MQIKLIFLLKNIKIFYFSFDFAIIIVVISEIITIFAALKQTYKMVGNPLSTGTKVAMTWRQTGQEEGPRRSHGIQNKIKDD